VLFHGTLASTPVRCLVGNTEVAQQKGVEMQVGWYNHNVCFVGVFGASVVVLQTFESSMQPDFGPFFVDRMVVKVDGFRRKVPHQPGGEFRHGE
jgi:hypothetical protein